MVKILILSFVHLVQIPKYVCFENKNEINNKTINKLE